MPRYEELSAKSAFTTFEEVPGEAEPKWHERGKLMSFNAYHGARAIAEALDRGAQIVVTGIVYLSLSHTHTRPLASSYRLTLSAGTQVAVRTARWCSARSSTSSSGRGPTTTCSRAAVWPATSSNAAAKRLVVTSPTGSCPWPAVSTYASLAHGLVCVSSSSCLCVVVCRVV
jgi:hypothetical protein